MANPEYRAFGGTDMSQTPAPASKSGGWGDMMSDPGFLSFMAGMGAEIDPQGVGGAIGRPTQQWIQQQQTGKAMEKQGQMFDKFLEALAGGSISKLKIGEHGEVSVEANKGNSLKREGDMDLGGRPDEQSQFQTSLMPKEYRKYQEEMTQGIKNLSNIFHGWGL